MASSSSSAQAAFGLGRRKKNPGLLDQIGKFFGGDKKRKGKGSFRGALSPAPQKASATSPRKRGAENAVVHFFRTIVSSTPCFSNHQTLRLAMKPGHTTALLFIFVSDSGLTNLKLLYCLLLTTPQVSPAPPKSRGQQKSSKKSGAGDGKGSLTRMFKMGSRSASPAKR
uniref:Myelin basic protein n=1 Tax=Cyprinodon variegatus TaxID=28743 RepID=A0A3Q2D986_CYPVA